MCSFIVHFLHYLNNASGHPVVKRTKTDRRKPFPLLQHAGTPFTLRMTYVFVQLQDCYLQLKHIAIIPAIYELLMSALWPGKEGVLQSYINGHPTPCNFPELRVEPPDLPPRLFLYLKRPDVNTLGLHCGLLTPKNSKHRTLKSCVGIEEC